MNKSYAVFELNETWVGDSDSTSGDEYGYTLTPVDEDVYTSEKKAEVMVERYIEFGDREKKYAVLPVYSK